jgi:hypothetical protein
MTLKRAVVVIVIWALVYFCVSRLVRYFNEHNDGCGDAQWVYNEEINAVIKKKYRDSTEHNFEEVAYRGDDGDGVMSFSSWQEGEMYDFLSVGDSIIKMKGSYSYYVKYRATGKDTTFIYDTACKERFDTAH